MGDLHRDRGGAVTAKPGLASHDGSQTPVRFLWKHLLKPPVFLPGRVCGQRATHPPRQKTPQSPGSQGLGGNGGLFHRARVVTVVVH